MPFRPLCPTDFMASSSASSSSWNTRLKALVQVGGPFLGLLLVCLFFTFARDEFGEPARATILTAGNLKTVLVQTVIVGIGALGMTLVIVAGGIDLSAGSLVACTSVLGARLIVAGWSVPGVILVVIGAGGLVGLWNGALISGFRLMPFIVTLGSMSIVRGLAKWLGSNQAVSIPRESSVVRLMAVESPDRFLPLPPGVWIMLGLGAVTAVVLRQSIFGRHVVALGSNEATARLCGVRVRTTKMTVYGLAGLCFGLAGLLQLSRLTQGDPTVAVGLELDMIAAVVIGGASLSGGTGSVLGALVGAFLMALLRNGTSQIGWSNYVQEIIIGLVIVLAVGLDKWRQGCRG
jgi:ribose transport system permease protein